MQFVDTNIFIRHLTGDDPHKAKACFDLLQKADRNEIELTTSEAVIAEIVYILSSSRQIYTLGREEIRARLYPILSLRGLKITYRKVYLRALDLYASYPLDFEDAVTIARMERQGIKQVISYDRDFDRVPTVQRVEP
jgi:predicted nucleic acid-binding protein